MLHIPVHQSIIFESKSPVLRLFASFARPLAIKRDQTQLYLSSHDYLMLSS